MNPAQSPVVALIVAVAKNGVIGINNTLPWRLPEDLKRFKALTTGHAIIMGRKTFESLGRPLPNRRNIVISRNPDCRFDGAEVFASLAAAIAACAGAARVFVIGGGEIYAQALGLADELHLTEVDLAPEGDAFFPPVDAARWAEVAREAQVDAASGVQYAFVTYRKK